MEVGKITFAQAKKKQAPILRSLGRNIRALDIGFQERKPHERPQAAYIVQPASKSKPWSQEIYFQGDTLKDTLRQVHIPMTLKAFKKKAPDGLRVTGRLKIERSGDEAMIVIFHAIVPTLANFGREVSQAARFKLADQGYRFTSLVELHRLAEENPEYAKKILFVGKDRKPVENLEPIFPENDFGYPQHPKTAKASPRVSVVLSINAA